MSSSINRKKKHYNERAFRRRLVRQYRGNDQSSCSFLKLNVPCTLHGNIALRILRKTWYIKQTRLINLYNNNVVTYWQVGAGAGAGWPTSERSKTVTRLVLDVYRKD